MNSEQTITWHSLSPDDFEGKAWKDTKYPFDRLPARSETALPSSFQWDLCHSTTGMCGFFETNSPEIHVKYDLNYSTLGEPNFNVVAFSGVDLYCLDESQHRWRWAGTARYDAIKDQHPQYAIMEDMPEKHRLWRMYLPMRNQLLKISVGVAKGSTFHKIPPRKENALVYYGTSLIHGAYSTRAGLGVPQIVARSLDMPLVNLGFSGGARMEPEMAKLLAELKPALFVIDPFHNMHGYWDNQGPFIDILCQARPETPILWLSSPINLRAWLFKPELLEQTIQEQKAVANIARKYCRKYSNLHFLDGKNFYGSDEVSTDGIHPNDQAFAHMSNILIRHIKKILGK